ncbi:MAG TPA: CdaR family protein [Pyrinomonadaceae bacterium]|nr:CdaR family protein [Pyrinomonadaceae bacterium]
MDKALVKRQARPRHWTQRWLRVIFVEDWGLKLLALVISLALWYGVTGQRKPTTIRVPRVPLNFRLPSDTEISNEPRTEVEITLTGSKRALDALNVRDLVANVDASDLRPGEYTLQLTQERVTMGLPDGVRYGDIQPNNLLLRLEPRVERELEVEVKRTGSVPEGYELRGLNVVPDKVKVRGPASHVNVLQKAPTQAISLDGRRESFSLPQTAIELPDKKVDLIEGVVTVNVEIGEQRVEKSLAGVSVSAADGTQVRPETASVTVYGERSVINQLRPDNLKLILDVAPDGTLSPRLELPSGLQGRVELRSTNPAVFTRRSFF